MAAQLHERRIPCQIMYEIMTLAARGEGKTRIMYGANISYALLVKYLGFLEERGFLTPHPGGYAVTERGQVFMADMARMLRHLQGPDGSAPRL